METTDNKSRTQKTVELLTEQNRQLIEMLRSQQEFNSGLMAAQANLIESIQELRQSVGSEFQTLHDCIEGGKEPEN